MATAERAAAVSTGAHTVVYPADTIVALATPAGRGAVGIVRLSGRDATAIASRIVGVLPPPRHAQLKVFRDGAGNVIDRGLVIHFPAPRSYTGEDVVELQGHGGQIVTELVLRAARAAGARQAEAGEFSRRAYLNDRMDLAQAEAVADLIDAASESAARAAERSLSGVFSARVAALEQALVEVRVRVEGALDFSEEDADWFGPELRAAFDATQAALDALVRGAACGRRLTEGFVVAIAGQPNVGKSTLLNRLSGTDAAIVTDIPGTTRDALREAIDFGGLPATVVDTAGLRESVDPIEREGVARARKVFEACGLILYLVDARAGMTGADRELMASLPARVPRIVVYNKLDLVAGDAPDLRTTDDSVAALGISAATGAGVEELVERVRHVAGVDGPVAAFSARSRHLEALERTRVHLAQARTHLTDDAGAELAAEELRLAQHALGEICGRLDSEALLGRIFSGFCIGK